MNSFLKLKYLSFRRLKELNKSRTKESIQNFTKKNMGKFRELHRKFRYFFKKKGNLKKIFRALKKLKKKHFRKRYEYTEQLR